MTTTQKALLSCSAVCYTLTLLYFFQSDPWISLLFFILHSISLLLFAYAAYRSGHNPQLEKERDELAEQCGLLTQENDKLSASLTETNDKLAAQSREYQSAKTELESALLQAKEEAALREETQAAQAASSADSLLPPLFSDGGDPAPLDIIETAREAIREFRPFAAKAGIQLRISSSEDSLVVKADPGRIRILFRNIIDNSIKYMNRAGSLTITLSTIGDDIFIVLKDNGEGLSEQETPHIFEMNYQGSNRISGNGLGLTQARAIVNSYGGTIYARSSPGKGMGIYIQIPIE